MRTLLSFAIVLVMAAGLAGCGAPEKKPWSNTYQGTGEDAFLLDGDFTCLGDSSYTLVGDVRIKNVLGHEAEAVAVAENAKKGVDYPPGTIIQLFPGEASVKRGPGFSPATDDWEFIALDVSTGRSVITARGTTDVANVAGSCLSCHGQAKDFDLACFSNHECPPLPFFINTKVNPDSDDPRCHPRY